MRDIGVLGAGDEAAQNREHGVRHDGADRQCLMQISHEEVAAAGFVQRGGHLGGPRP